jgi:hypothetical protein
MTQPEYVPITPADRVRPADRLPAHAGWRGTRPADATVPAPPKGTMFGSTGSDLGYGLKLARRFQGRLELAEGEHGEDAVAGCFAVGTKRSSLFGRSPMIYDMELAFTLWGFLGGAPADLVRARRPLFEGVSHHYWEQWAICDAVPEETLRMTPALVRERLGDWRVLLRF